MGKVSTEKIIESLSKYREICSVLNLSEEKKCLDEILDSVSGAEITIAKKTKSTKSTIKKNKDNNKLNKINTEKPVSQAKVKKRRGRGVETEKLINLYKGYINCDEEYIKKNDFLILTPKCNVVEAWKKRKIKENLLASKLELLVIYNLLTQKDKIVYVDKRKEIIANEIEEYIKNNKV